MKEVTRVERILGIMIHEPSKLVRVIPYVEIALKEGFDDLVVFTPSDVNLSKRRIHGYIFREGDWIRSHTPFPTIAYDVGYYLDPSTKRKVNKIKKNQRILFMGSALGNKLTIQKHLMTSSFLLPYLIPTQSFRSVSTALDMVKKYKAVMIKPIHGMGGKGIIRLSLDNKCFRLKEDNKPIYLYPYNEIVDVLREIQKKDRYIVQKWVDIRNQEGYVYDIRVLMQKNAEVQWELTGMGVRQGAKEKITSNLKGGGSAFEVFPFLQKQFGEEQAEALTTALKEISFHIPLCLERSSKKSLIELGLDLAVDKDGHIWIVEVNNKPDRTILKQISNVEAAENSVRLPIQYAISIVGSIP
jgi:glutathione synthase/RimK-type ligase-like ATP-grasp enzyme